MSFFRMSYLVGRMSKVDRSSVSFQPFFRYTIYDIRHTSCLRGAA